MTVASCSDDDNNEPTLKPGDKVETVVANNINTIFTKGLYRPEGATITRNADGTVAKIEQDGKVVTFDYVSPKAKTQTSRATSDRVSLETQIVLTVYDGEEGEPYNPDYEYKFYVKLNDKGFLAECVGDDENFDGEADIWTFKYNSDSQLNYVHSTSYNRTWNVTYSNGDITKVEITDDEPEPTIYNFGYTDGQHSTPIVNKGSVMMFYNCFEIDLDQLELCYLAGLLGKPTKHLPLTGDSYGKYTWTFNADELPTQVTIGYDTYTFAW